MKSIFFCFFFFLILSLNAQPPSKFFSRWGGSGHEVGYDIKETLDKGYIITGSTTSFGYGNTDLYLVKLDSMGRQQFEVSFGGLGNEIGKSVVQLPDSNFVAVGYTNSDGLGGYDIFLVKIDPLGKLLWKKNIGGEDWDFANSLQCTLDGGLIIAGYTYSFGKGKSDGYLIKTDRNGTVIWSKTFGGKADDEFKSLIMTSHGDLAMVGYTKSYGDSLGDAWILKTNINGDSLWGKVYGGNREDFATDIIENKLGYLFVSGATASFGSGLLDAYAFYTDSMGNIIHSDISGTSSSNEIYQSVTISKKTSDDIVCFIQKGNFPGFNMQTKIIEYDFGLNYRKATDYGSVDKDETFKVISTSDKGYAFVGYTNGYDAHLSDVYFVKLDSDLVGGNFSIVSLEELSKKDDRLIIFPNPVSDKLYIYTGTNFYDLNIELFDLFGNKKEVKNEFKENKITILDLYDLADGMYVLKIGNKQEKIMVLKKM